MQEWSLYLSLKKQESIYLDNRNEYAFNTLIASVMETLNAYEKIDNNLLLLEFFYVGSKYFGTIYATFSLRIEQ